MIGHSLGPTVMMQLGGYQFSLSTSAYQELRRRTEYSWPSQDRFGKMPTRQFTGPGNDSITLTGVIFTEFRGGTSQVERMRAEAGKGKPLQMIDGAGRVMGRWVVESIEETQSVFAAKGQPRKQEFTLQLGLFEEPAPAAVAGAIGGISGAVSAVADAASGEPKSALAKLADRAAGLVGSAISSVNSAIEAVKDKAEEIGNAVGPVIATASNAVRTARDLQNGIQNFKGSLQSINSLQGLQSAAYSLNSLAAASANAGALAASAAKAAGISLPQTPDMDEAASVLRDAEASCGRLATTAASISSSAQAAVNEVKQWA